MIKGFAPFLALAVLAAPAAAQPPADRATALAAVDKIYSAEAAAHPIGGMTVGVVDHGRLIWTRSYGFANIAGKVPAARDTVYRIGSITKQFTGVALLQLAAQGKLRLDDPAVGYVPELHAVKGFDAAPTPITLLSLATHRAGLSREPDDPRFLSGPIDRWQSITREALGHVTLEFTPNGEAHYSNIGYAALGLALEKAAGRPYTALVEDGVVKPLGMTSTSFRPDAGMLARLAKGYGARGDSSAADTDLANGRGYKIPNGGLFTTVDDLARFLAFEMGYGPPSVLPREAVAQNLRRSFPMGGAQYGVGFTVELYGSHRLLGHNGSVAGFSAAAVFDPNSKIGLICLRNADQPCEGPFMIEALAALTPNWADEGARLHQARAAVAKRIADQKPYPGGEAAVQRLIDGLRTGQVDYTRMSPAIADVVRSQSAGAQTRLTALGALQTTAFKGIDENGADVYRVTFAKGALELHVVLSDDGVLRGLSFRPIS